MQIKIKLLILILFLSLSLNLYFYLTINDQTAADTQTSIPINFVVAQKDSVAQTPFVASAQKNVSNDDLFQQANNHFKKQQFDLAIEIYSDILIQDDVLADELLTSWLHSLSSDLKNDKHKTVATFTNYFFNDNAYHIGVLQLEAQRLTDLEQYQAAIKIYKDIIDNSFNIEIEQRSENQVHQLVQKQYSVLSQQALWKDVVEFIEPLLFDEPNYPPYLLMLSKAKIELNQLVSAQKILQQLSEFNESPAQVEMLLQKIEEMMLGESAIPLLKLGVHYVVNGQFDPQSPVNLMIDTGASLSVLSQIAFDNLPNWLNPIFSRQIEMNTAGGIVNAQVYTFEQFQISGYRVKSIEFAVMDLDTMKNADGLLGMNFLKHFVFQIDQENNQLILNKN